MLTLIAESKTMAEPSEVSRNNYIVHTPVFENIADEIMDRLRQYSQQTLAATIGLSDRMARYASVCIYDFPDKSTGCPAIDAFTGVVFRALDPASLSPGARLRAGSSIRIISSLYGWLRPEDIIKPYRFDFTTRLAPGDIPFMKFWKKEVTAALVANIRENRETEVLNLLPADAAKCIDWKEVAKFADVYVAEFRKHDGESLRSPHAGRLKQLRGLMLRDILEKEIHTAADLRDLSGDDYIPKGELQTPRHFIYLTD